MPACADTSVNSIGPDGRGGVGLGEGDGAWLATSVVLEFAVVTACGLQAGSKIYEISRREMMIDLRRIGISLGVLKSSQLISRRVIWSPQRHVRVSGKAPCFSA